MFWVPYEASLLAFPVKRAKLRCFFAYTFFFVKIEHIDLNIRNKKNKINCNFVKTREKVD